MTTSPEDDEPDEADGRPLRPVPPLPPDDEDDDGELDEPGGTQASSYEVELDDEPDGEVGPVHEGDGYKLPLIRGDRRAIVPKHMRSVQGVRRATWRAMDPAVYNVGYYGLRVFRYVPYAHFWAIVGLVKLANVQRAWWWVSEQTVLRQLAVVSGASAEWRSLHSVSLKTRSYRGLVLLGELIAVLAVLVLLAVLAPWWGWAIFDVAAVVPLAWYGQPASHPIITPSMIKPRHRKINADIVLRACYRAKLGDPDPDKPDDHIEFAPPGLHRDGDGSRVTIDLPYGRTFDQVMKVRKMLASGLDVSMNQLFLYADPSSERRFSMWIADTDPLATPAGPTPLLDLKPRNIWKALPFGLDQRGAKVLISLMWTSFLIGAQPRKGKTWAARIIALFAALDPYVRLVVVDGKNAPDWIMFKRVAHRFVSGTHPTADGDPVEKLMAVLREVRRHIEGVNEFLKTLPAVERPEGKLTETLARKYAQLRVWVLVLEEFQLYFELEDQAKNKEVAGLLNFIKAVGPSAGVIVVSSSQKPSGVGAGDVQRLFNRFRDNHDVRFALKCGNRIVSEAILGGDAYSEGLDASALPLGEKYRGVGILYGLTDDSPTLRTFRANDIEAEKIVDAALRHRQRLGLLTGDAIAEELDPDEMNILADVLTVFGDDVDLQWEMLAERLREVIPERHANMNGETISAAMRKEEVPSVDVRFPKTRAGIKKKGCRRADVQQTLADRELVDAAP